MTIGFGIWDGPQKQLVPKFRPAAAIRAIVPGRQQNLSRVSPSSATVPCRCRRRNRPNCGTAVVHDTDDSGRPPESLNSPSNRRKVFWEALQPLLASGTASVLTIALCKAARTGNTKSAKPHEPGSPSRAGPCDPLIPVPRGPCSHRIHFLR
jgi:hypothetical protein